MFSLCACWNAITKENQPNVSFSFRMTDDNTNTLSQNLHQQTRRWAELKNHLNGWSVCHEATMKRAYVFSVWVEGRSGVETQLWFLLSRLVTARAVSCGVKQTLLLNTHWLTFIEVCLPPTCLISIDFNWRRSGNCNSADRPANAKKNAPWGQKTKVLQHVWFHAVSLKNTRVLWRLNPKLSEIWIAYFNLAVHPQC